MPQIEDVRTVDAIDKIIQLGVDAFRMGRMIFRAAPVC